MSVNAGSGGCGLRLSGRVAMGCVAMLAMGALTGCGPKRLRADFTGFEKAYAETSNREVLLNLARLQNRDPTYFFKLGQIASAYRMTASVTGSGNYVNAQGTLPGLGNVNGGGSPGLIMENDPSFTFVPVNDDTNAQLLLRPIPAETFFGLYQQGWRLDQLFRLMVDRIEWQHKNPAGECVVDEFRNVPPMLPNINRVPDPTYQRSQDQLSRYATFLRVAAVAYALQKHGHLVLKGQNVFRPYDVNGYTMADLKPGADPKTATVLAAKDISDAAAKGDGWRRVNGQLMLGHITLTPIFYLSPATTPDDSEEKGLSDIDKKTKADNQKKKVLGEIQGNILKDPDFAGLANGDALMQVLEIVSSGFSIEGDAALEQAGSDCSSPPHLYLRSLLGLMAAAAQEEVPFEDLLQHDPAIHELPGESRNQPLQFSAAVPEIERVPVLRLRREKQDKDDRPLVQVDYKGRLFQIADAASPDIPENQYWNRDMFRLTTQLTSQVTVDISKFPLPETLQIHQ